MVKAPLKRGFYYFPMMSNLFQRQRSPSGNNKTTMNQRREQHEC